MLLPVHYESESIVSEPFWGLGIAKSKINIREAWEIGPNDPDLVAFGLDDEPIIPDGVENPPFLSTRKKWARTG